MLLPFVFALLVDERPIFAGGHDWDDFKIDYVFPTLHPLPKKLSISRFHDLKAAGTHRVDPARVINQVNRHHPAIAQKPFPNRLRVLISEGFDDQEEHG